MTAGVALNMAAFVVGAAILVAAARRRGLATEGMAWVALAALGGGVLGARVTEWLLGATGGQIAAAGAVLDPRSGGRTILGGVLCGWAAVEVAKRRLGIVRSTGDLFALALPAGEAVGRLGCFVNGCCYGTVCTLPWAVHQHGAWRHPAQLYSSAAALATLALLLYARSRVRREGDLFRLYLLLFAACRFGLEFVREHPAGPAGLSVAQWICVELGVTAGILLYVSARRGRGRAGMADIALTGEGGLRDAG